MVDSLTKIELTHEKKGENLIITIKGRLDAATANVAEDCTRVFFNVKNPGPEDQVLVCTLEGGYP